MGETLEPDGFNVLNSCGAAAWQTVFHFHLHVVPRYDDDPLKLPWVPRPGDPERDRARSRREIRGDELMAEPTITLERDGDGRLDRALEPAAQPVHRQRLRRADGRASTEVEGSDARALVWRAEGEIFTGGVDVNAFQRIVDAGRRRRASALAGPLIEGVQRLEALEIPTLALVHGLCLTAGLEVALGCDLIWAERVVEVRPGRGGRRAHPGRRRHPADGRARRARRGRASS